MTEQQGSTCILAISILQATNVSKSLSPLKRERNANYLFYNNLSIYIHFTAFKNSLWFMQSPNLTATNTEKIGF